MAASKTIIVGDELATGISNALRKLPNTLPLWTIALPGWPIVPAAAEDVAKGIKKIEDDWQEKGGAIMPTNVLVSAGRAESMFEPDDATAEEFASLADDTKHAVDTFKSMGANVLWILPPAMTGERKARSVIAKAAEAAGARVFHGEHVAADTKTSRSGKPPAEPPPPADIPDVAYDSLARMLETWVPIGPPHMGPIVQRHPSQDTFLSKAKDRWSSTIESVSSWSTPAKVAGGVAIASVLVGGAYAVSEKEKKNR